MTITIDTDAAHFHQYNSMSYAFAIKGENINYKESGYIPVNVSSSTEAEFISVGKAIDYLYDKGVNYDTIIIKCDNTWITTDVKKYKSKAIIPHIKELRNITLKYKGLVSDIYGKKRRLIIFQYAQARKGIDTTGMNEWCDRECKRIGRINIPELSIKIKTGVIKEKIGDWVKAILPKRKDYNKTIKRFYEREYKDYDLLITK